jgi:hypothetical protein
MIGCPAFIIDGVVYSTCIEWGTYWCRDQKAKEHRDIRQYRILDARKKGTHTKEEWLQMKKFFRDICVKCEGPYIACKDHILPLYLGGSDSIKNIQPLCYKCNQRKTNNNTDYRISYCEKYKLKMPEEWQ